MPRSALSADRAQKIAMQALVKRRWGSSGKKSAISTNEIDWRKTEFLLVNARYVGQMKPINKPKDGVRLVFSVFSVQ